MVTGPQKGFRLAWDDCPDGVYQFHEVGIVKVDNNRIGWPKCTNTRESNAVAEIFECEDDNNGTNVLYLKTVHVSMYMAVHQALQLNTKSTIVAA
jgi:hypothetical protein